MKNVFLRSDYSVAKISKYILLSLIPLIIAGFYKNGLKLYTGGFVSGYGLLKPLILTFTGLLIGALVNVFYEYVIKRNNTGLINTAFSSFHPVYGILVASVSSINTDIFLFIPVVFILFLISKFIPAAKLNIMALTALIIILLINFSNSFTFLNAYENAKNLNLVAMDYLLGKGSGGINTTYAIFLLVSLVILANQEYYKRSIPLFASIIFAGCMIFYGAFISDVGLILDNIFGNGILFCFVYLATDPLSSSYTRKGKMIFGSLIGFITFGLFLLYPPLAALGAILIVSLLHELIDKLILKK